AIGGNLSQHTLLDAYRQGIFPWYESGQPILWWSPDPRAVIFPDQISISRSLKKTLRVKPWEIRINTMFQEVVDHCAAPRRDQVGDNSGTWITQEMKMAYLALHHSGYAHSLEVWLDGKLVGGLYGILVGGIFCGESMFSLERDASKIALVQLALLIKNSVKGGFIDCQIPNNHLLSMGAVTIPRREFLTQLRSLRDEPEFWPDQWSCKIL
ncbi:UNVERIFIED_CONTAM: hypothetical protein GTU68_010824, partial [Idotea baltica]|nr:hypothetical protein [Idotea baltica]